MKTINPFSVGSVVNRDDFYGFKDEIRSIEHLIDQSVSDDSKHICFIGEPNTGKTSFMRICELYCQEKGFLTSKINVQIGMASYDFYNDLLTQLLNTIVDKTDSRAFAILRKQYNNISQTGRLSLQHENESNDSSDNLIDLEFPLNYYQWKDRNRPANELPNFPMIEHDFKMIINSYNEELGTDEKIKFALFLDDFQHIIEFDDRTGNIKNELNYNNRFDNLNNICETLRNLIERHSDKYMYFLATYPGIVKDPFDLPKKLISRHFTPINVNKFDNEDDTQDIILGAIKNKLNQDHNWYKTYILLDTKIWDDFSGEKIPSGLKLYFVRREINRLVKRVHKDSDGRPFAIKHEMSQIFNYFEEPILKETDVFPDFLIDFADAEKWQKIYKAVSNQFKDNKVYDIIEQYSLERKFHLYLLLNNMRLNIDELIEYYNYWILNYNLNLYFNEGKKLSDLSDDTFTNENNIFIQDLIDLRGLTKEKLRRSLEKFEDDSLIYYELHETKHYQYKLNILDLNYIHYHFTSLNFPDINSQHRLDVAKRWIRNGAIFCPDFVYNYMNLELAPSTSLDELLKNIAKFFNDPNSVKPELVPYKILSRIYPNLGQYSLSTSLDIIKVIDSESEEESLESGLYCVSRPTSLGVFHDTPEDTPEDTSDRTTFPLHSDTNLIHTDIIDRYNSLKNPSHPNIVVDHIHYDFSMDHLYDYAIKNYGRDEHGKLFVQFLINSVTYFVTQNDIYKAIEVCDLIIETDLLEISTTSNPDYRKKNIIEDKFSYLNTRIFLTICTNKKKEVKKCLTKYKEQLSELNDLIKLEDFKSYLFRYNLILLKIILGQNVFGDLVSLMEFFLKDESNIQHSQTSTFKCAVYTGQDPSFISIPKISVFEGLFLTIKQLIKEGEKMKIPESLNTKMHSEFEEIYVQDDGRFLSKIPQIESLLNWEKFISL